MAIFFIFLFIILPTFLTISWFYYKNPVYERNKKEYFVNWLLLILANIIFLTLFAEFPYTLDIIEWFFKASIIMFGFLTNPNIIYCTTIFVVYVYLSIILFKKTFLKRSLYWIRRLILHKPNVFEYPNQIKTRLLIGLFIISIIIVYITNLNIYLQDVLPHIYLVFGNGGMLIFILPLLFNFIICFLFKGVLKLIRFVGS